MRPDAALSTIHLVLAGPLEATINNLNRELAKKDVEGKDLQRHWINLQTELVAKQNDNSELSESHARLTSNFSILNQKKVGLEQALEQEEKQVLLIMLFSALSALLHCNLFLMAPLACRTPQPVDIMSNISWITLS